VVEFTGGRQQAINIPVLASVKGDLRILPSTISFGVIDGTKPIERRVRFENHSRAPISIKDVETSDEAISVKFTEIEPGKKGVLVVTVDPTKVARDLRATVKLTTDHPKETELLINVFGVIPSK
jgi:hypothetical protein